jgi:hypothetical protein
MRLNPQEARVLLRVALLKPRSMADLQRIFDEYLSGSSAPTKGRRE